MPMTGGICTPLPAIIPTKVGRVNARYSVYARLTKADSGPIRIYAFLS